MFFGAKKIKVSQFIFGASSGVLFKWATVQKKEIGVGAWSDQKKTNIIESYLLLFVG